MRFERIFNSFEKGMLSLMGASNSIKQAVEHCLNGNPEISPTTVVVALAKNIFWADTKYQPRNPKLVVDGQIYKSGHDPENDLTYDRHGNIIFPAAPLPVKNDVIYMTSGGVEFGWMNLPSGKFQFHIEWVPRSNPSKMGKNFSNARWTCVDGHTEVQDDFSVEPEAPHARAARFHT